MSVGLDDYLWLDATLHLTPFGGIIISKNSEYSDIHKEAGFFPLKNTVPWYEVNTAGALILSQLDGSKKVREIIKNIWGECYKNTNAILSFIDTISNNFKIHCYNKPQKRKICVTGDKEYFWPLKLCVKLTEASSFEKFCYKSALKKEKLPTQQLLKILNEFYKNGTINVEFTGGEPLLHPDFFDIVDWSARRFKQVVIATNGYLVDDSVAQFLAKYSNVIVQVSLDGSTPDFHDRLRGKKGAWKRAVNAIYKLVSEGIYVRAEMTIFPENVSQIDSTIQLACELNVPQIIYNFKFRECAFLNPESFTQVIKQTKEVVAKWQERVGGHMGIKMEKDIREFSARNCGSGKQTMTLTTGGELLLCPFVDLQFLCISLLEKGKIKRGALKNAYTMWRDLVSPGSALCIGCDYYEYCNGCIANGLYAYQKIGEKCKWGKFVIKNFIKFPKKNDRTSI